MYKPGSGAASALACSGSTWVITSAELTDSPSPIVSMHTNRISPARKILFWLGATLGLFLLTGCDFNLANLTPASIPENPSSIYTIQARAVPKAATIVPNSLDARLVI
ncbi:MAG: hypothetical protein WCP53_14360, partial [Verrucomicrobiota bacterium]